MSDRKEKILNMECPCCGNKHQCKMSCERAESFKAFKQTLIWLPFMTNEQLAHINFECWVEAQNRAAVEIEQDVEKAIDNIKKNN